MGERAMRLSRDDREIIELSIDPLTNQKRSLTSGGSRIIDVGNPGRADKRLHIATRQRQRERMPGVQAERDRAARQRCVHNRIVIVRLFKERPRARIGDAQMIADRSSTQPDLAG